MTAQDTISAAVQLERQRRGWTQRQLASELGWGTDQVSRKLSGARSWTPSDLDLLSERLGVPLPVLLMGSPSMATHKYQSPKAIVTRWYRPLMSRGSRLSEAVPA